ncbi:hypothetical protein HL669_23520 [Vibrio parahaemolyticus]|nr:hypothetical protein [Vibrio parahaemolyticus]NNU14571.1 hypothetical protein [Vibrio parahaemolyticus]
MTRRLKDALVLVDVTVLDHFVVGREVTSFAKRSNVWKLSVSKRR